MVPWAPSPSLVAPPPSTVLIFSGLACSTELTSPQVPWELPTNSPDAPRPTLDRATMPGTHSGVVSPVAQCSASDVCHLRLQLTHLSNC
jgi:hypothetical protein